jgi:hypothetical protein
LNTDDISATVLNDIEQSDTCTVGVAGAYDFVFAVVESGRPLQAGLPPIGAAQVCAPQFGVNGRSTV